LPGLDGDIEDSQQSKLGKNEVQNGRFGKDRRTRSGWIRIRDACCG
jgi:hypothetical protein